MGSSVSSSFLILSNLLSGRMTLKIMVILCLGLVVFTEAYPIFCAEPEFCSLESVERKKRSPELTEDDNVTSDGSTEGDVLARNAMNDAVDTIIKSNESEDNTDDSEQMDDMSTGGYGGEREKREEKCWCPNPDDYDDPACL